LANCFGLYLNLACKTAVSLVTVLKLQKNANGAAFASGASEKNFGPGGGRKVKSQWYNNVVTTNVAD